MEDFADAAAAVAHLGLVIMTDSAVAHLAGALDKPFGMRLFRPRAEGEWDHVFAHDEQIRRDGAFSLDDQ